MIRLVKAVAFVTAIAIIAFVTVPAVRTAVRTAGLLAELLELGVRPLSAVTPTPIRTTTSYGTPIPDRMDVYLPADARTDRSRAAVVLSLGIHPLPLDHPDVIRVAEGIARLGVVVGVPESTALRETRVTTEEPGRLAEAFLVVAGLPQVDPARMGLAGFSAGASIALVAAADPRIADSVAYVSSFGAYADAETLLVDVATRTTEVGGVVAPWAPEIGIRRDVAALMIGAIEPSPERDRLAAVLEPVVGAETAPRGPDGGTLATFTHPDVRAAYLLFTSPTRADARAAIAGATTDVRAPLVAISPLSVAPSIRSRVFLLHGEADTSIAVSHARLIAAALPDGRLGRLTIFRLFQHVQPGKGGLGLQDVPDVWELYLYLHDIVALATE